MKKLVIIGGVAGGASCAARARRLSETAKIVVLEKGDFVSFANCGLPYHIGDVIPNESDLLLATPKLFLDRFNIEVRLANEVLRIDRQRKKVEVKDLKTQKTYEESYDVLLLSPGASPIRPPLPGSHLPGIFTLRNIPDTQKIKEWIHRQKPAHAVVMGGGFIGLEMAENLAGLGMKVSVIEMQNQVLPPFDPEMMGRIHEHLRSKGVNLGLGQAVSRFEPDPSDGIRIFSHKNSELTAGLVLLCVGVRPENQLAKAAGLEIGPRGGIKVDSSMRTSDLNIWAVGDAVEVEDYILNQPVLIPLAGPANRQGRIAANNIFGKQSSFRGIQGTAGCKVFDYTVAITGASEKNLKRAGIPYKKIYCYPEHHAAYYPGSRVIDFKLLVSSGDGRLLGAQAVGEAGVEKRIDVIAMALQMKATVYDLEEVELTYAPPYGSAKDPVNIAGMIAANDLRDDAPLISWEEIHFGKDFLLDVRTQEEFNQSHVKGAKNIPLDSLKMKIGQLPRDREINIYCGVGKRGHVALSILKPNGFLAKNITGGFRSYLQMRDASLIPDHEAKLS